MSMLGRATWRELMNDRPLLVLPLGSTEQHGPHLPLDTDTRVASAVARGLAGRLDPVLLGPAMPYGASGEHAGFPGTVSLGTQVLERVIVELVRSVDDTAHAVMVVNGHGGNAAALMSARRILAGEGRPVHLWAPAAALARTAGIPAADHDLHAGRTETSLLLHLATAGPSPSLDELVAQGVAALSPTGVLGDPAGASAAEGARLLDAYVDDAVERLLSWARRQGITPPAAQSMDRSA